MNMCPDTEKKRLYTGGREGRWRWLLKSQEIQMYKGRRRGEVGKLVEVVEVPSKVRSGFGFGGMM